jgi:hypothetical protein
MNSDFVVVLNQVEEEETQNAETLCRTHRLILGSGVKKEKGPVETECNLT